MSDGTSARTNADEIGELDTDGVDDSALNRAFDLLRGQELRYVLKKLRATSEEVISGEELVEYLLAHDPDADDADRVRVSLYHRTLPRLADAGVIDFGSRTDTVRYQGSDLVEELLGFVTKFRFDCSFCDAVVDAWNVEETKNAGQRHLESHRDAELPSVFAEMHGGEACHDDCGYVYPDGGDTVGFDCPDCGFDHFPSFARRYLCWQIEVT